MSLLPLEDLIISVAVVALILLIGEFFWRKEKCKEKIKNYRR